MVGAGRGAAARPAFEPGNPIPIAPRARGGAGVGDLVTVRLRGGGGEVVAVHGPARSASVALHALLVDQGLGRPFPLPALEEAEAAAVRVEASDRGRRDLTAHRVLTIDPEGAKDHDDALALVPEGDLTRLFVHIADVAAHVPAGGVVDREAERRGTSVYLPGMVDPMLPPRLSNDLCSLRPGVDRRVVTVEILIDERGEVHETRFSRATIRSERRLTYPEVDDLLAGRADLGDAGLEADVRGLAGVAGRLLARRRARGALEIQTEEPVFRLVDGRVVGVVLEGQTPAHSLVEECMVAANEAVARHLIARGAPTVYRFHDHPDGPSIERLYDRLEALEVPVPPLPEGPLAPVQCAAAAAAAARAVARHVELTGRGRRALPALVLRALRQAYYAPDRVGHSGLASPVYLHFTSPIRRYPDLLAHRSLLDTLGAGDPAPDAAWLAEAAVRSSEAERAAADLEHRANRLCAALLLRDDLGRTGWDSTFAGEVSGVVPAGCFVAFGTAYEGFLPVRRLGRERYHADPLDVMLVSQRGDRSLRLGDAVEVRVADVEALRGRVDLEPPDAAFPRRPTRRAVAGRRRR
jgi:ribonuclease R